MKDLGYLLALHRRLNLTALRYQCLTAFFAEDWQKIYQATRADWQAAGMDNRSIEKFFSSREIYTPTKETDLLQGCGAEVLTPSNKAYPRLWHQMAQPPAVVCYRGNVEKLNQATAAIVGTRRLSRYGQQVLDKIIAPLMLPHHCIVSGLAFGADAAAHRLALNSGASTVAVLGTGIDHLYPSSNRVLGEQILLSGGLVVSEYLPKTEPRPEYFPQRNRLVAGLSKTVIVLEGAVRSGSLITARLANEFGREVWAVPGDIFLKSVGGCNQLIAQGEAAPLLSATDLQGVFGRPQSGHTNAPSLNNQERAVLQVMQRQPAWEIEPLCEALAVDYVVLSSILTVMELKGVVEKRGAYFSLI